MSSLPGRCTNEMFCSLGASGRAVMVPAELPFVCPMCGKPLSAPETKPPSRLVGVTMFGAGICVSVIVAFAGGIVLGIGGGKPVAPSLTVLGQHGLQAQVQRHIAALPAVPPLMSGMAGRYFLNSHSTGAR